MPELELVTVPNVHLASVGTWECMTGVWECTAEELAAIVEAQDDAGIRTPVIKLGHVDRRFDGEPSVGRIENLRLSDDGLELYADLVGVPKWIADVMGSAWPDRSVEVLHDYTGATGHKHRAVLSALALLGVSAPAIESLDDIKALYGIDEAIAASDGGTDCTLVVLRRKVEPMPKPAVQASVSIDAVRSTFYDKLPAGSWAWIREVWSDFLIVDDDEGGLFKITWSEGADGAIEFGDPEPVEVQYVSVAPGGSEEDGLLMLGRFAPQDPKLLARDNPSTKPEEGTMPNKDLLVRLGLPEDASQEDIDAAVLKALDEKPEVTSTDDGTKPTIDVPEGAVIMDAEQVKELVAAAGKGAEAHATLKQRDRDAVLDAAIKAGKFPKSRRDHYVKLWDADEDGTRTLIETLAAGLVPVGTGAGHATSTEDPSEDAMWAEFQRTSSLFPTPVEG